MKLIATLQVHKGGRYRIVLPLLEGEYDRRSCIIEVYECGWLVWREERGLEVRAKTMRTTIPTHIAERLEGIETLEVEAEVRRGILHLKIELPAPLDKCRTQHGM